MRIQRSSSRSSKKTKLALCALVPITIYLSIALNGVPGEQYQLLLESSSYASSSFQSSHEVFSSIEDQIDSFLQNFPDTPGAKLIHLLQNELYYDIGAEERRIGQGCWPSKNQMALCYGGVKHYQNVTAEQHRNNDNMTTDPVELEQLVQVGPFPISVYELRRFRSQHLIPSLGTGPACLPLALAASTLTPNKHVAVELGPFAGMSSKCIAIGLPDDIRLHAFDTFDGKDNFKAIWDRLTPEARQLFPDFSIDHSNFVSLWRSFVHEVKHPSLAIPHKGWIHKDTMNFRSLKHQQIGLLSVDSAKSARQLKVHLEGIHKMVVGTILFLMDFELVDDMVKQIYACLRGRGYLAPVYVSWNMEHWAFVILKPLNVADRSIYEGCYNPEKPGLERAKELMEEDLIYLSGGLSLHNPEMTKSIQWHYDRLRKAMLQKLEQRPNQWKELQALFTNAN